MKLTISARSTSKLFCCNKMNVNFYFYISLWYLKRNVRKKIYVNFYYWIRFRAVDKGYRARIIIKIGLHDFSSEVRLLIFFSTWAVLLYIFIYSFSQLIDSLRNMQSLKQYNSNFGLVLTLFFARIYFYGWKLLFRKICKNLLGSSPLFQQENPDEGC